ncbi:hypothetical protein TrVE_jg7929 [Triparma verrucosa]|uniref:Nickel/cobalt efflux system n=1 Tax=Triparma verrucosa TaxID=1606542 RepID=A0A9W7CL31_9STRA|nr:hypothetical protein TrVE_jg7929 [Triparma verrucosa]
MEVQRLLPQKSVASPPLLPPSTLFSSQTRLKAFSIAAALVTANVVAWALALTASSSYPQLASPCVLAFTFGLRHAVDADHIAAIDNVTRKLMRPNTLQAYPDPPLLVGLYFSLGHSTVVVLMCVGVALGSAYLSDNVSNLKEVLAPIGTTVSAAVLLLVSVLNFAVARNLIMERHEKKVKGEHKHYSTFGGTFFTHKHMINISDDGEVEKDTESDATGGIITRCCPNIFDGIDAPWKMYPIGFLFGLGFDTASEVALLGLTAMSSSSDMPVLFTLLLPILFTTGMSLIDTLNGMMMLATYSWADNDPSKRLFFNLFLTILSATIALVVAVIEILGRVQDHFSLCGSFWDGVKCVNDNFEVVGYGIIVLFACSSLVAFLYMKYFMEGEGQSEQREKQVAIRKAAKDEEYIRKRMLARAMGKEKIVARDIDI